jgi:hypothetical protein
LLGIEAVENFLEIHFAHVFLLDGGERRIDRTNHVAARLL